MHGENWARITNILSNLNVRPIVAVIPNNQDAGLCFSPVDTLFWQKVSDWENIGWHIGVHGWTHTLKKTGFGLFPISQYSEFVGDDEKSQLNRIKMAVAVFHSKGISPKLFVAPAHGLDKNTVEAIRNGSTIRVISDGFYLYPFRKFGMVFCPQQIWKLRAMPFGIWTVCLHPSNMSKPQIDELEDFIQNNSECFPDNLITEELIPGFVNRLFGGVISFLYALKHVHK